MHVTAIIAAGGAGRRLGGDTPKQHLDIGGGTMLEHSTAAFTRHPRVSDVIVVLSEVTAIPGVRVVKGGARRQDSVANGFGAVPANADVVLIHDAARPFVTAEETRSLRVVGRHPVSLNDAIGGDGERALEDFLGDPGAANPGQMADLRLLRERMAEVLRSLAPREREVIELRFGLRDGHPRTLDEVAKVYGITRERIRQIEARGLLKLRQPLRSKRLAEFAEAE